MEKESTSRRELWTKSTIHKLFRIDATQRTIVNAEERGEIPKAERVPYGERLSARKWRLDQLPEIGTRFGFLKHPKHRHVICVYTAKGGVLKTTFTFNLARALALNGIRTAIVGLDSQCSVTDHILGTREIQTLDQFEPVPGLFHLIKDHINPSEIIKKTDLPTLDIVPETVELIALESHIRERTKREEVLQNELLPHLENYSVIIFDTPPSWNLLIMNALTASNHLISPIGCDLGSFQALTTNLSTVTDFGKAMDLDWDTFVLLPTLLASTKLSTQILHAYIQKYTGKVTAASIRRAVKGEESLALRESVFEYDPTSPLAEDYYSAVGEIWGQIIESEKRRGD